MKPTPTQLRELARSDAILGEASRALPRFPGFPGPEQRRQSRYESLAREIVFQQLAYRAAQTIWERVVALTAGSHFPRSAELPTLSDDELRGAGLSRNKLLAIRDLAERCEDGRLRLRGIHTASDEEISARLVEVRGIGPWTAQMFLLFHLGRLDVMPTTDLGIQEGLRRLDGLAERPTPKAVFARSQPWAPLRSVASWYLWRLAGS